MASGPASHRRLLFVVFAGCVALMSVRFALTRSLVAGDSAWYYAAARSLLIDHDLDLSNEYQHFANDVSPYTGNKRIIVQPELDSVTGRLPSGHQIGTSLAILPFMAVVHLFVRGDGYGAAYQLAAGIGSAFYALLGLLLLFKLGTSLKFPLSTYVERGTGGEVERGTGGEVERGTGARQPERALLATMTIWLATPLVYYMTIEPLMSHAASMFSVSALLVVWIKSRDAWSVWSWALMGLLGGFAIIERYQEALFCAIPVLDLFASGAMRKAPRRAALALACFVACIALVVPLQLYANFYYYGSPWVTGYPALREFNWFTPALWKALFSLHNGLFTFAPVTILALVGLFRLTREQRTLSGLLVGALLVEVYVTSAWTSADQGATFGNRMLLDCTPIFAIGLMRFLDKPRVWLCTGLITLNAVMAALYCARILSDPYIVR